MEKVTVTKEVAEAIEALRSGVSSYGYWRSIKQFEEKDNVDLRFVITRAYFKEDVSLFTRAMFGEYEIEESSEERVSSKYKEMAKAAAFGNEWDDGYARGIKFTLETLGISIKGVNA